MCVKMFYQTKCTSLAFQSKTVAMYCLMMLIISCGFEGVYSWPEGTYGLPMTDAGCPNSDKFYWHHGSRNQQTGTGSYASEGNHLAGTMPTKFDHKDRITQNFCMKTSNLKASEYTWDKGAYCIYKQSQCPIGMKKGTVYWNDNVSILDWTLGNNNVQSKSGEVPDGKYEADTRIEFCCRTDGSSTKAIKLPTDYAFYLFRLGPQCQKVAGMELSEESVEWAGNQGLDRNTGSHPVTTQTTSYMRLYYCYYKPEEKSAALKIIIICVLSIVAIVIFAGVVIFIAQRCVAWRCDKKETNTLHGGEGSNTDNLQQAMLDNTNNDVRTAIYRPGVGVKSGAVGEGVLPSAPPRDNDSRPMSLPPSYEEVLRQDSADNC